MKRKIFSFTLSIALLFSMFSITVNAASIPTAWKAPGSLCASETNQHEFTTSLFFSVDSALTRFIDPEQTDHEALGINSIGHTAQIDWKLNSGNWHYTSDWDTKEVSYDFDSGVYYDTGYLSGETTEEKLILDLRNTNGEDTSILKELGNAVIKGNDQNGDDNRLDLQNNTVYFRVRLMVDYYDTAENKSKYILSPWSETLAYGKEGAVLEKPVRLEKPHISNPVAGKNNDGSPNISFTVITPKQVQDSNNYIQAKDGSHIEAEHEMNINNSGWVHAEAGGWWLGSETRAINVPVTYDNGKVVKVDSAYIQIRMRYVYNGGANVAALKSEWSNTVSVNTPEWENASSWAVPELKKANEYGLITDRIKNNMTAPITREEFAEVVVKLYEKYTGKAAGYADMSAFVDTKNPEIFKAYDLKIVNGTNIEKKLFTPNDLINREQVAAMLYRAVKALKPDADMSTAGAESFSDASQISGWALDNVKFMNKNGFIKGSGGRFDPKGTCTREMAVLIAVRVYEKYAGVVQ